MPSKNDNVYQGDGFRWLSDAEICAKLSISQSTRERRVKAKILPEPTRLGPRCKRTREDLIDKAIAAIATNPPPANGWGNPLPKSKEETIHT
jgi:predicted DNA-binding transcriptional regulator AlpA